MHETKSSKKVAREPQPLDEQALDQVVAGTGTLSQATSAGPAPGQVLSNIGKTRAGISLTFARNARA